MPTPPRTSLESIVTAGRQIVERDGLDGLTMQKVAAAVGVRAPSLYKHVDGRAGLIRLIADDVVDDLGRSLGSAVTGGDPEDDLSAIAHAFRDFARRNPGSYRLVFAPAPLEWRPSQDALRSAVAPVLDVTESLSGPERSLEAARVLTAWAHGFVSMELAGAFRLGGDLDDAFSFGVDRLTAALGAV